MGCGTMDACAQDTSAAAFSTLCGPMGCGTHLDAAAACRLRSFQYPLRAYGVWNISEAERCASRR